MKGLIALDIDGTITIDSQPLPKNVIDYFHMLVEDGWKLVFITGRIFRRAHYVLEGLTFPYYLAVQNGAILIEMPSRNILSKKYLNGRIIPTLKEICEDLPTDFVVYAGFEHDDACFFRSKHFSSDLLEYLKRRCDANSEIWTDVPSLLDLHIEEFPSVKCFGSFDLASEVAKRMEQQLNLHVPVVKDPFSEAYYVSQATHPSATKGWALRELVRLLGHEGKVIVGGDDQNDFPMMQEADIKIVMKTAPSHLLEMADIVAPSAAEEGIIIGLTEAISLL